jgi:hypothetical protein
MSNLKGSKPKLTFTISPYGLVSKIPGVWRPTIGKIGTSSRIFNPFQAPPSMIPFLVKEILRSEKLIQQPIMSPDFSFMIADLLKI